VTSAWMPPEENAVAEGMPTPLEEAFGWWVHAAPTETRPETPAASPEVVEDEHLEDDEAHEDGQEDDDDDRIDYRRFRRSGVISGLTVTAIRMGSFFGLAAQQGAKIVIDYFVDVVPYPVVLVGRAQFAELVSRSTLYTSAAMLAIFVIVAFRHAKRNQTVSGWFMGMIACCTTLATDVVRHLLDPPVVVYSNVLWTLWPIALSCSIFFFIGRSKDETVKPDSSAHQDINQDSASHS
jgi:hypothetical protein